MGGWHHQSMRPQRVRCDLETQQHIEEINKLAGISRNISSLVEVFCDYILSHVAFRRVSAAAAVIIMVTVTSVIWVCKPEQRHPGVLAS